MSWFHEIFSLVSESKFLVFPHFFCRKVLWKAITLKYFPWNCKPLLWINFDLTENKFCKIRDDEYLCTQVKTFISQKFCQKIGGHKLLVVNKGFFHQEMFLPRLAQIKFLEQTSLHIYQTFHKSKDSLHFVIFLGNARNSQKFSVYLCLFIMFWCIKSCYWIGLKERSFEFGIFR